MGAETTTTFRSEVRSGRRLLVVLTLLLASACRKDVPETKPEPALPLPARPPALLAEGVLRRPQATWSAVRAVLGDTARGLPTTLQLAVAGALGIPPLSAGLIDPEPAIALSVVDPPPVGGVHLVLGIGLTSGAELLSALTAGTSPPFSQGKEPGSRITVLTPRGGSRGGMAMGVVGDRLVVSDDPAALAEAGAYVGLVVPGAPVEGDALELTFPAEALAGAFPEWLGASLGEAEATLIEKDEEGRRRHGGRAPDFGDPRALVSLFSGLRGSVVDVVRSASRIRIAGRLEEGKPSVEVVLTPAGEGAARALARSLSRGSAAELLALPTWVEAALLFRQGTGAEKAAEPERPDAGVGPGLSVLGDRLAAAHRARLGAWVTDLRAGLGDEILLGVFSSDGAVGAVALGPRGAGADLGRALATFPQVLALPAVAEPITAFVGKVSVGPLETRAMPGAGPSSTLALRTRPDGPGGIAQALSLAVGSRGARVAAVLAAGPAEPRLHELLFDRAPATAAARYGDDPAVVRAVERGRQRTTAAVLVRFQEPTGAAATGMLLGGTTGEELWAEFSGPGALAAVRAMFSGS